MLQKIENGLIILYKVLGKLFDIGKLVIDFISCLELKGG